MTNGRSLLGLVSLVILMWAMLHGTSHAEEAPKLQAGFSYTSHLSVTKDGEVTEFDSHGIVRDTTYIFTAVASNDHIPAFVVYYDGSVNKARYWVESTSSCDKIQGWVESFDSAVVSMRVSHLDPLAAFRSYAYYRNLKIQADVDEKRRVLFTQRKGTMRVDAEFLFDERNHLTSFTQDLFNQKQERLREREVVLSGYGENSVFSEVPGLVTTTITLPVSSSKELMRSLVTTVSRAEILSAELLPADFNLTEYLGTSTAGFTECTKDYDAMAAPFLPTPYVASQPPGNVKSSSPALPSSAAGVVGKILWTVGGSFIILAGVWILRSRM